MVYASTITITNTANALYFLIKKAKYNYKRHFVHCNTGKSTASRVKNILKMFNNLENEVI